jgi:hypothetical protein
MTEGIESDISFVTGRADFSLMSVKAAPASI